MTRTIPYYNPNLRFSRMCRALIVRNAQEECERYYRAYSGKRYVILTVNCRSALLLAYKAMIENSAVIASPLVCRVALAPIAESGNKIIFADVEDKTWNIDVDKLPDKLPESVKAIQLTHIGGVPGDIERIIEYAHAHGLMVIEDCAQGFGSWYKGKRLGSFGDVACFSGIKTTYGISGGVLATDDKELYDKVRGMMDEASKESTLLSIYRALRNGIDTYRSTSRLAQRLYAWILGARPSKKDKIHDSIKVQRPSALSLKIWAYQLHHCEELHRSRTEAAQQIVEEMNRGIWQSNYHGEEMIVPTKLYLRNPNISSASFIEDLNRHGIQAMHLQQKYASYYQDSKNDSLWRDTMIVSGDLKNFEMLHDTIVSVPLYENMTDIDRQTLINKLQPVYG